MRYSSTHAGNYTSSLAVLVAQANNCLSLTLSPRPACGSFPPSSLLTLSHSHSLQRSRAAATRVIKPSPSPPTQPSERDNGKKIICKTEKTSSFITIALYILCSSVIWRHGNNDAKPTGCGTSVEVLREILISNTSLHATVQLHTQFYWMVLTLSMPRARYLVQKHCTRRLTHFVFQTIRERNMSRPLLTIKAN